MARKKVNLKDLINETHINYKIMCGELGDDFETEEFDKFEKIKPKIKHTNSEIGEYQFRKKKLNHTKRGQK